MKTFIGTCHEEKRQVDLRPLVTHHNGLVRALYDWLFPQFLLTHGKQVEEVNQLILHRNAILGIPT